MHLVSGDGSVSQDRVRLQACTKCLHVHRVSAISVGKVESGLLAVRAETESLTGSSRHGRFLYLLLVGEVLLDHIVRLHVDLLVCVSLAVVDLLHALALFNEESVAVDGFLACTGRILVHLSNLQDILKTIKCNLDNLVIRAGKKIAQRFDASLVDQVADLLRLLESSRGGV